jgi:hypothetical protein
MPSLDKQFLLALKEDYTKYNNFIESGTFYGETTLAMEPFFNKLYTVEIKQEFYTNFKNNYKGNKIEIFLGESSDIFTEILPSIQTPSIFFLDGHWSCGNTGKGKKDCPLYEELTSIINNFKYKAIIIIDDVRLFGMGPNTTYGKEPCNWEDINIPSILNIVKERVEMHYHLPSYLDINDRLILHLSQK